MSVDPRRPSPPSKRRGWFSRLVGDMFVLAREEKKWWLMPMLIVLLLLAALMAFAALTGPLAPFFYPLL